MSIARCRAAWGSFELDLRLKRLRREETDALAEVGKAFRARVDGNAPPAEPVAGALARVTALEEHERTLSQRLAASLEADRSDYRAVNSDLGRWLIVARGILDRLVLRDEVWRAGRELPKLRAELGKRVLADAAATESLPAEERTKVLDARAALERTQSERAALLEPYGGRALPTVIALAFSELATFAAFLKEELSKKMLLRLPALAAMVAGWWIARSFTSSLAESHWNRFTGSGRTPLPEATLDLINFWAPLLAAALVAYLSFSLGRRVRRHYLGPNADSAS